MRAFCPFCEKEYNNLEIQTRYEITTLNGVTAEWQKKYIVCPDCGEELYNDEMHDANLRVVYAACKVSDIDKPVEDLCDYVLKLRMEIAELRTRLNKERAEEMRLCNEERKQVVKDVLLTMLDRMDRLTGCGVPYHVKKFINDIAAENGIELVKEEI